MSSEIVVCASRHRSEVTYDMNYEVLKEREGVDMSGLPGHSLFAEMSMTALEDLVFMIFIIGAMIRKDAPYF